jgi:hypothetical protein
MPPPTPRWDANNHTLWLNDEIITEFIQPAELLEPLLAAFQAANWERRIANPFLGHGSRGKEDAHNACRLLNERQKVIRFRTCDSGQQTSWQWRR